MNETLIFITIHGIIFFMVTWIAYSLSSEINEGIQEAQSRAMQAQDASLSDLYLNLSPKVFLLLRVIAGVVLFLMGTAMLSPVLGLLLGVPGFIVPQVMLKQLQDKRIKRVETQLVEGLELLGNSLKSGLTLPQAVELLVKEMPAPISQEFSIVLSETRLGVDFNDALSSMAERLNSDIVRILASGVAVTKRCGGDLTVIFQNIASTIRSQATIQGKLDAVTSQGRFQGMILGFMPFALIIILYFVDRAHVETLFGYTLGIWAIILVVGLVVMAQLWMRKLLAIDV